MCRYAGSIMSSFINVESCYAECHCVECCGTRFIVVVYSSSWDAIKIISPRKYSIMEERKML
jgi:hypothetical protein